MLAALRVEGGEWPVDVGQALSALPAGHGFTVPSNLFAKISDDAREEMEARFAGV
jgi:methionyl-tRNA synthetase